MKILLFIPFFVFLFFACQNNNDKQTITNDAELTSINELLSDTFKGTRVQPLANIDSIEFTLVKKLKLRSIAEIENLDAPQLSNAYLGLFNILNQSKDSSKSDQNKILYVIFEKLNSKQVMLEDSQVLEIKNKLQIAQLKSQIRPYFKK